MDWRWPGSVRLVKVLEKKVSISFTPFFVGFVRLSLFLEESVGYGERDVSIVSTKNVFFL